MTKFICIFCLLLFQNCSHKSEIINGDKLRGMVITIDSTADNPRESILNIKQKDSINYLLKNLNDCEREPLDFYATYRIKMLYDNGVEGAIFCLGTAMKYKELTYRLNRRIESTLSGLHN